MQISYADVLHLHLSAVATSISLFIARAGWVLRAPERLQQPWVKVVPHLIDTALLLSGVWLAWQLGLPGVRGWLPFKLCGLLLYIVLGSVALKRGRTPGARAGAAAAAVATFAYIASVAVTKSPLGLLAL